MKRESQEPHAFRGVKKTEDGAYFGFALPPVMQEKGRGMPENDPALLLFKGNDTKPFCRISLKNHKREGTYFLVRVRDLHLSSYRYAYEINGRIVPDLYARSFQDCETFGQAADGPVTSSLSFLETKDKFSWGEDERPRTPFSDSIFYSLHVRGYTKSKSSKVPEELRGTFAGLTKKIAHIKSLGVTAVELMPCCEFDECRRLERGDQALNGKLAHTRGQALFNADRRGLNFWGYEKAFGYFAPKAAYCADRSEHYTDEFKQMVRQMHKAGLEVILQFYFADADPELVRDCLHFWVSEYHVDGFHLYASKEALAAAVLDPYLADTKLIMVWWNGSKPSKRHVASYTDQYKQVCRRFLKGDGGQIREVLQMVRDCPETAARINSITDHNGFTLYDLYAYERAKKDGGYLPGQEEGEDTLSWNCGTEGPTRSRKVNALRERLRKNAILLLMVSQGTPLLRAGDEFLNSQDGYDNPYDVDDERSWVTWNKSAEALRMERFIRQVTAFRQEHKILHADQPLCGSDTLGAGYPDFSVHGQNAWFARTDASVRQAGLMFAGNYADPGDDTLLYVGLNMYWEPVDLALPQADKKVGWTVIPALCTDRAHISQDGRMLTVPARSICLLQGKVTREKKGFGIKDTKKA